MSEQVFLTKTQSFPQGTTENFPNPGSDQTQPLGNSFANSENYPDNFPISEEDDFSLETYIKSDQVSGLRNRLLKLSVSNVDDARARAYWGFNSSPESDKFLDPDLSYVIMPVTLADIARADHSMFAPNIVPPVEVGTAFTAVRDNPVTGRVFVLGKNGDDRDHTNANSLNSYPSGPKPNESSSAVKSKSNRNLPPINRVKFADD